MAKAPKTDSLPERIKKAVERHGNDEKFMASLGIHLRAMEESELGSRLKPKNKDYELFLSEFFVSNPDIYPVTRFACQTDGKFDWGVEVFPSEKFSLDQTALNFWQQLFYQCLKVGDVLDCQVASLVSNECKLKVLCKHHSVRLLYCLNIFVSLPLLRSETAWIKGELSLNDLIRVAVLGIDTNVKVTVDERILSTLYGKNVQLGKISKSDLPSYLWPRPELKKVPNLTQYLNSSPAFHKPSTLTSVITGFGLDGKRTYTIFSDLDRICPEELTGQTLLQEAKDKDAANFLCLAETELEAGNFEKAVEAATEVLTLNPKCIRAYEIRGLGWIKVKKRHCNAKSSEDFNALIDLDNDNDVAKQYWAKVLHKVALKFKKIKEIKKALLACEYALALESGNEKVTQLFNTLKEPAAQEGSIRKLEEEPLNILEQKKIKIQSRLQQIV